METVINVSSVCKNYFLPKESINAAQWLRRIVRPEYDMHACLTDINFSLRPGSALGFIGPNGAGKSSLIKILCGIQKPTSGSVRVLGFDPSKRDRQFLKQIGAVFGHKTSLWWDLPVKTSLDTYRKIYGVSNIDYSERLSELVEALNLANVLNRPVRNLSLGERVKCELALNLMHAPTLIFLDEPTVGLDVTSKYEIRKYLNYKRKVEGLSIFLTSHDLGDIESCCEEAIILDRGRIRFDGSMRELNDELKDTVQLTVTTVAQEQYEAVLEKFKQKMQASQKLDPVSEANEQLVYVVSTSKITTVYELFEPGIYTLEIKALDFENSVVNLFNSWASE